jgi:anhydro-N-acetylmuramic acid kinase
MTDLYIGMLSGTSRDGVDLVLTSFESDRAKLHQSICLPYPPELARFLHQTVTAGKRPGEADLHQCDKYLTAFFTQAVKTLLKETQLEPESITAIGSHGQTVWHDPPESIQLGDPQGIANNTGITTVGHFRQADLASGGEGAPLAPLLHRWIFQPDSGTRVVLNLGGIANISVIQHDGQVRGFDTGPANCLLDGWIREHRGTEFDHDGEWSASGQVNPMLLLHLMADPYFKKPPPKSTGVEYFNLDWLKAHQLLNDISAVDVQATLAQLTASTVAAAVTPFQPDDVLVCGGGSHNTDVLSRLQTLLPNCEVTSTEKHGLHPDSVEGVLFAWLARECLAGCVLDTRDITGASKPVLLGEVKTSNG